jgi:hypothetical protein
MDIMPAFEAVVGGSNPSGCTSYLKFKKMWITMLVMFIKDIFKNCLLAPFLAKYVDK